MIKKRKICIVTGSRADYGLLYRLMKKVSSDDFLVLQLLVTGMHLSSEFGLTYKQIEKDGFEIDYKVEMLLSSDTAVSTSKSMGLGMIGFADAYETLKPNLIVVLGDRFEIFSAVCAAMSTRIPVAHIHGGETTEGAYDESIRHSITKMSHLHFTSTEIYRNRVIQLGEQPKHVFNVGAPGIDNIKRFNLLSIDEFEKSIDFMLDKKNLLVTFHPVTLENTSAEQQFSCLLKALDGLHNTHIIFTKANADTGGRIINNMIDEYVNSHLYKAIAFTSLGQLRYLSAMQYVDGVIGNSSSGLIEAPTFNIGTVNIGDRQKGRIKAESVVDCLPTVSSIKDALTKLYSTNFNKKLKSVKNPYGEGETSERILGIIKTFPYDGLIKKIFYDMVMKIE
jgi:GDP/UDP-N,N'-diacetylbacillosamine 2-epimerase (hydrolysing)